jgi:hypothetical protein
MFGFECKSTDNNAASGSVSALSGDDTFNAAESAGTISEGGVAVGVLKELYYSSKRHTSSKGEMRSSHARGKITIALSAWILRGQHVIE